MTKLKMARTAVVAASAVVLSMGVVGMASAQQGGGWDWGWDNAGYSSSVDNDNDLVVSNDNHQQAYSGEAEVEHNKDGGDAKSGDAANGNTTGIVASVTNGADVVPPASPSPEDEQNWSSVNLSVDNDNDVKITNSNSQSAVTGDAEVHHNTTGGNATSGNAANTNTTTIGVTVGN